MSSIERRLNTLERLKARPAPSRTEIEAWGLNNEITELEKQMVAEGLSPWPIATDGDLDLETELEGDNT